MDFQITPEPDETERAAILAALAAEQAAQPLAAGWDAAPRPGDSAPDGAEE